MNPKDGSLKKHIISLGGLPGSGKSTVKRLLAEKLDYKTFSTGDFVRNMAFERNLTLEELNELIAHDKSIDTLIDEQLIYIEETADNYVVDSHLAFYFIPSGFSVFLLVTPDISAERIFKDAHSPTRITSGDTMQTIDEALHRTQKRVKNHIDRYKRHYSVDPYEIQNYTFVVDTENKTPEMVSEEIYAAYMVWLQN